MLLPAILFLHLCNRPIGPSMMDLDARMMFYPLCWEACAEASARYIYLYEDCHQASIVSQRLWGICCHREVFKPPEGSINCLYPGEHISFLFQDFLYSTYGGTCGAQKDSYN